MRQTNAHQGPPSSAMEMANKKPQLALGLIEEKVVRSEGLI